MSRHEGQFEQFKHAGHTVSLCYDQDAPSPRDNDGCLCTMACWHRRAELGDRQLGRDDGVNYSDRDAMVASLEADGDKVLAIVPIWIYEHSGIWLHAQANRPDYPYNCQWDSGQCGWAYVLQSTAEKLGCVGEYTGEEGGGQWSDRYENEIFNEVAAYDRWQRGEFAGYIVEDKDDDVVDSCWGYDDVDYCRTEAKSAANHAQASDAEARKRFPERDWKKSVTAGKTKLGYEAWLKESERALHKGRTGT